MIPNIDSSNVPSWIASVFQSEAIFAEARNLAARKKNPEHFSTSTTIGEVPPPHLTTYNRFSKRMLNHFTHCLNVKSASLKMILFPSKDTDVKVERNGFFPSNIIDTFRVKDRREYSQLFTIIDPTKHIYLPSLLRLRKHRFQNFNSFGCEKLAPNLKAFIKRCLYLTPNSETGKGDILKQKFDLYISSETFKKLCHSLISKIANFNAHNPLTLDYCTLGEGIIEKVASHWHQQFELASKAKQLSGPYANYQPQRKISILTRDEVSAIYKLNYLTHIDFINASEVEEHDDGTIRTKLTIRMPQISSKTIPSFLNKLYEASATNTTAAAIQLYDEIKKKVENTSYTFEIIYTPNTIYKDFGSIETTDLTLLKI